MENMEMIRWIITAFSVLGAWLNASMTLPGLRRSFLIWMVANFAWVVVFLLMGMWPEATLFAVYYITALRGHLNTRCRRTMPAGI